MAPCEWVIDIIKEWVLSLTYATQAWVTTQIAILKTWVQNEGYATQVWVGAQDYQVDGYISRGDPNTWDFDQVGLIFDGTWRDLDLSAIVPADVHAIDINLVSMNNVIGRSFLMRHGDNANGFAVGGVDHVVAGAWHYTSVTVPCNAGRHIQYMGHAGGWVSMMGTIKGWWF